MSKVNLNNIGSLTDTTTAQSALNLNFGIIQAAFDDTVSRNGASPNQLTNNLDVNNNRIINLPQPVSLQEPLRLTDLNTFNKGGTISTIPAGGLTHNVLEKTTNTDFSVDWTGTPTFTSVTSGNFIGPGTGLTGMAGNLSVGSANTVVTNANLSGPVTSVGNTTAVAQTGTGSTFVMNTSPTITTPVISGHATIEGVTPTGATGTGNLVFGTSPTFVTPVLGTPSSGNLSSCTGILNSLNGLGGTRTLSANIRIFTTSGTYTPTTGMVFCIIECVGGGGAGGGTAGSATTAVYAGGGGGGGYSRKYATAATIGASQTVTIGTGGTCTAGANTGGAGGDTSVGILCVGKGGSGGAAAIGTGGQVGGAGGILGTGDFTATGGVGGTGSYCTTNNIIPTGGFGGYSHFGGGALAGSSTTNGNGNPGQNYGSGGSGAWHYTVVSNQAGGSGAAGVVVITEYILV